VAIDSSTDITTSEIDRYPRRLLMTILSAVVVFSSSMTIVSASLPTMAVALNTSASFLSWAVTGLFLVMAVTTPIMGRLGDTYGHRRLFLTGASILSFGTLLCAIAPTAVTFVAARMLVGLGISATMPNGTALIMAAYPLERRSEAMGWFQMTMTGAPVLGLIAGGPLIEAFGWRSVFAVLFPLSLIGLTLAWRTIRIGGPRTTVPIDYRGAASLAVATLSFLLWLERAGRSSFTDQWAFGLLGLSLIGLAVFIKVELTVEAPMLRLAYFRRRNFTGPLLNHPLNQFAYMGGFLIAPIFLNELFGYSVAAVALVLLFRPGAFSIFSPVGGRLARVVGERRMLIAGSVLMTASMISWVFAAQQINLGLVILGLVLSGIAMGISSPSYSTAVAAAVDPRDLGVANGMGGTMMTIGMLTGIQVMFTILGEGRAPSDFVNVFAFGGGVALLSLFGALLMTGRKSSPNATI
jgi:MFS family permease